MHLTTKITLAALLGSILGYFLPDAHPYFQKAAEVFFKLINMIVVALVLSSVTLGIIHFKTPRAFFNVAFKTLVIFVSLTIISLMLGVTLSNVFHIGTGLELTTPIPIHLETPSIGTMLLSWIPTNPLASLANGNIIQILIFAAFLGIAINAAGQKARPVTECLESIYESMLQITSIVLTLAPFGIFVTAAYAAGTFEAASWTPTALKFFLVYILGIFCMLLIYTIILKAFWRLNITNLIAGMRNALYIAFATGSSTATLPVTIQCMTRNLGISRDIAGFVAPMGATLNLNGLSLFHGMCAVFVAQAYNIPLGWEGISILILTATLTSLGTGGIPGASLLQLYAVFKAIGLPIEGIAWIAAFEAIREIISTVLNVIGNTVSALGVAQETNNLNRNVFFYTTVKEWESSI
ncbi:MAG: dicarboxylate/amino acid:cation symporter [Parachlamydiales bacterium]|jgi:Na+/H+-dicarboxylate symporter